MLAIEVTCPSCGKKTMRATTADAWWCRECNATTTGEAWIEWKSRCLATREGVAAP
jgi:ribosomal protein L37AE/L43A